MIKENIKIFIYQSDLLLIMPSLKLVEDIKESRVNIKRFNEEINTNKYLQNILSRFRHWYYSKELNMFGPSKFIGYKNMNCKLYSQLNKHMSGTDTEYVLRNKLKLTKQFYGPDRLIIGFLNRFRKNPNIKITRTKID